MSQSCIRPEECRTLQELFEAWKNKQKNEEPDSPNASTFPEGIIEAQNFKESFCVDGFTSAKGRECPYIVHENRPLFILKEANVTDRNEKNVIKENGHGFWFNDKPEERGKYKKILICLDVLKVSKDQPFGYMNLNKRGGFGRTYQSRLSNYVIKYREFIRQQIAIMKPSVIICCGCYDVFMRDCYSKTTWRNLDKPHQTIQFESNSREIPVYYVYHPAARGNYEKNITEMLKKQIGNK